MKLEHGSGCVPAALGCSGVRAALPGDESPGSPHSAPTGRSAALTPVMPPRMNPASVQATSPPGRGNLLPGGQVTHSVASCNWRDSKDPEPVRRTPWPMPSAFSRQCHERCAAMVVPHTPLHRTAACTDRFRREAPRNSGGVAASPGFDIGEQRSGNGCAGPPDTRIFTCAL
jgi:hypothetical protein